MGKKLSWKAKLGIGTVAGIAAFKGLEYGNERLGIYVKENPGSFAEDIQSIPPFSWLHDLFTPDDRQEGLAEFNEQIPPATEYLGDIAGSNSIIIDALYVDLAKN